MALDILRPRGQVIDWSVLDAAQGVAAAQAMLQGRAVWNKYFAGHAIIDLALRAEVTRLMAEGVPPITDVRQWEAQTRETPVLGATDKDLDRVPEEVAMAYRAMRRTLTSLYATRRPVPPDTPTIDVPIDVPGAIPVIVALTVVGVAAIAGVTWFATEAAEQKVELEKHRITVLGQIDLYLKDLQARIAAGAPLPDPPDAVIQASNADSMSGPLLIGAGLLLGAAAVGGAVYALRKPRAPAYAGNPLRRGYSRKTISGNIARERRRGKPRAQAVAMSMRSARTSYKRRHPKKPLPKTLRRKNPTHQSGYAFELKGARKKWRTVSDEAWDTVMTSSDDWKGARFLGTRTIDGSRVNVWKVSGGYLAQTVAMTGNPKRKRKAPRKATKRKRRAVKRRAKKGRRRKKVIRPHGRKSKKCRKCGRAHSTSEHWSHAKAAKKGPRGGAYKRKRAAKKRSAAAKRAAATRKRKKATARKRPPRKRARKRTAKKRQRRSARRKR